MLRAELEATRDAQWDHIREYLLAYAARRPVRTIAVVGNAPLAPDAGRAATIDAADLVIRANAFVLDGPGEEPTSGTACHAVLFSRATTMTPSSLRGYRDRAYLVPQQGWVQYRTGDHIGLLLHAGFWPDDLGAMPLPNGAVKARVVHALDPTARPGSVIPTTGLTALFLAHEMFPDADLVGTGFSFLEDERQTSWAHHSGGHTKVNWQHHLDLEAALLRSWIADGSLRILS
ncbi:hypothetical protein [Oryzobacter terrae]|uniref:hypothetical protein n=1 Tax=Oryzobacter terrae TaxID=1620385 RepID=UPI00366FF31E